MFNKLLARFNKPKLEPSVPSVPSQSYITDTTVNYVIPNNVIVEPVPAPEMLDITMVALGNNRVGSIKYIRTSGSQLYRDDEWYTSPYTDELTIHMHGATVNLVFMQGMSVVAHCHFNNNNHKVNGCKVKAMYTTPVDSSLYDKVQEIFYKIEEVFESSLDMALWDALESWHQSSLEQDREQCDGAA